ncbi:MAG: hypothetical protein J7L14_03885 [Candidatus Diapherotrites archaeon]|nr:hypothetical protein [Candidatus Diapherotrites archaeon]
MQKFWKEVSSIKRDLKKLGVKKKDLIVVEIALSNWKAFFSLAPLSRAIHELGADISVFTHHKGKNNMLENLKICWKSYKKKEKELIDFISDVEKKDKKKEFRKLFKEPEFMLKGTNSGFKEERSGKIIRYRTSWLNQRRRNNLKLRKTAKNILKNAFGLKKDETFSVVFELVPKRLDLPLQDYLDNFAIAYSFANEAKKICRKVYLGSSTMKESQLDFPVRCDDLAATLKGCWYDRNVNEEVFKKFKKFALKHNMNFEFADAVFGIHGKGYAGKHIFGLTVGYPDLQRKTRWQSPGQMFLKPFWLKQTAIDRRRPTMRYAITETLPIERFVNSCNIDYMELRKRYAKIKKILELGDKLYVEGKKLGRFKTEFSVDLKTVKLFESDDANLKSKINHEAKKLFNVLAGNYGNFPAGEVFFTPGRMQGKMMADVTVSIDRSYVIPKNNPLVIEFRGFRYKITNGPKKIIKAIEKKKKESWQLIKQMEKTKALPKRIIETYKKNFNGIGEVAINTNPNAKLGRYLIECEKIAKMMHVAIGSGYEPERETLYHIDAVINAPRQKLNVFVKKRNEKIFIIKRGELLI